MIYFENSELHNEATRTMTDAAASAQTAYGCYDVLRIREDSGIVDSRKGSPGIPIGLRQKALGIKENWLLNSRILLICSCHIN
jgi:hypothetical protein